MFKVGELVTTLDSERAGLVLEIKFANALQYCRVLFVNEDLPTWRLYTTLREM
jgi:hypothetical protein